MCKSFSEIIDKEYNNVVSTIKEYIYLSYGM